VVSFTPLPLYPGGESPRYPLDRWLGGPQSQSGRRGEKKIVDPTGTRTPISVVQSVASRYIDYAIPLLRTVCNTGIYCSSDKVGTVYLV
jgi:hypothetical protein